MENGYVTALLPVTLSSRWADTANVVAILLPICLGRSPGQSHSRKVGAAGVIECLSGGSGEPDAQVELAGRQQPGVAGELARPRLDDERGAEDSPRLVATRMLQSLIASSIAERTRRVNGRDASAGQRCRARLSRVGRGWSTEPFALPVSPMSDVTRILSAIEQGDPLASEGLLPLVYDELRKLAAAKLAQEKPGQTLQATALVHEAYVRLVDVDKAQEWDSRGHFFAAAAEAMRRILVDHAREKAGAEARRHAQEGRH